MGRISSALALCAALTAVSVGLSPAIAAMRDAVEKPLEAAEHFAKAGDTANALAEVKKAEAVGSLTPEELKAVGLMKFLIDAGNGPDVYHIQDAISSYALSHGPRLNISLSDVGGSPTCADITLSGVAHADVKASDPLAWMRWAQGQGLVQYSNAVVEVGTKRTLFVGCRLDEHQILTNYRLRPKDTSGLGVLLADQGKPYLTGARREHGTLTIDFRYRQTPQWTKLAVAPAVATGTAHLMRRANGQFVVLDAVLAPVTVTPQE